MFRRVGLPCPLSFRPVAGRLPPLFLCAAIAALLLSPGAWADPGQAGIGDWTTAAPAPAKRTEVVAAAIGGRIYLLGGFISPSLGSIMSLSVTDLVEVYDTTSNTWTTAPPMPIRIHHAGAAVHGGKLYVAGGYTVSFLNMWQPVASVHVYDPVSNSWSERTPMPTPRGALALVEHGGKLYAIGGYDRTHNIGALEVYDPATDRWSTKSPLPTPRDHLTAGVVNGRIYAIGGRLDGQYSQNLGVTEMYDPATDRWSRAAAMPTPRSGIGSGVIHGTIYVVGGESPDGTFRSVEAYHPDQDRWDEAPPMPTGRHGLGVTAVGDRLFTLAGGPTPGGSFSSVVEVFSPLPRGAGSGPPDLLPARAPMQHVGAVMTLLAVFDEAGALPPQSSPDANRLIKALIQFQAAFMKSPDPKLREILRAALSSDSGQDHETLAAFQKAGWDSRSLEAVVEYLASHPVWQDPDVVNAFRAYNVGRGDFDLMARTYQMARSRLSAQGKNLHAVFADHRGAMPGTRDTPPSSGPFERGSSSGL